jgi:SPX domain protein involved in polyphosphate accumulation
MTAITVYNFGGSQDVMTAMTAQQTMPKTTDNQAVFSRNENKYLVSRGAATAFMGALGARLTEDRRGTTTIRNWYLDTPNYRLIRRSIEKPQYKEKFRVRTYGEVCGLSHEAFLEIRKKLDGRVYKRRLALSLAELDDFLQGRALPQEQIARELAWSLKAYGPVEPVISVIYERCASSYPSAGGDIRITVDRRLAAKPSSRDDFSLSVDAPEYEPLLPEEQCVMEIKAQGALPLELVQTLSHLEIYPTSFSKVGTAYARLCHQGLQRERERA